MSHVLFPLWKCKGVRVASMMDDDKDDNDDDDDDDDNCDFSPSNSPPRGPMKYPIPSRKFHSPEQLQFKEAQKAKKLKNYEKPHRREKHEGAGSGASNSGKRRERMKGNTRGIDITNIPDTCTACTASKLMKTCTCHKIVDQEPLNHRIEFSDRSFSYSGNRSVSCPRFLAVGGIKTVHIAKPSPFEATFAFDVANLLMVDLSCNRLTSFLSADVLKALVSLTALNFSANSLTDIAEEALQVIALQGTLSELDLSYNELMELPPGVCHITSLKSLYLQENMLVEIPTEFLQLKDTLIEFDIDGNNLSYPLQETLDGEKDKLDYIFTRLSKRRDYGSNTICTSLKVVLVGNESAGKTTLARNLRSKFYNSQDMMNGGPFDRDNAAAIDIHECTIETNQEPPLSVSLKLWDFGGQKLYHCVHELFFSRNALYLLMWDVNIGDENDEHTEFDEHVQFWIDLINARAPV